MSRAARRIVAAAYLTTLTIAVIVGLVVNIAAPQYAYYTAGGVVALLVVGYLAIRFWPEA